MGVASGHKKGLGIECLLSVHLQVVLIFYMMYLASCM